MRPRRDPQDYLREETYGPLRLPVDRATTLIPEAYVDPSFHDLELARVFGTSWVAVGLAAEVGDAGDVLVGSVGGASVIVTRDREGRLHAFYNTCRHRGSRLIEETTHLRGHIRCPYHSWAYTLGGELIGTPLFEGSPIPDDQRAAFDMSAVEAFDRADYGLLPVRVEAWGPLVFVNLDATAMPLAAWIGDLGRRLDGYGLDTWEVRSGATFRIEANWKLVAENFIEYYHLPWVHPDLSKVSKIEDHHRYQGDGMYMGMTTSPISRDDRSGWLELPPAAGLEGGDAVSGRFVWLFPNVALSVLPNHAFVLLVSPEGPGSTIESAWWLGPPGSSGGAGRDEAWERIERFWTEVNREDIEIVERVHRGIASTPYPGGRLCYRFEEPLHRFQNIVADRMLGIERIPAGDAADQVPMFAPSG